MLERAGALLSLVSRVLRGTMSALSPSTLTTSAPPSRGAARKNMSASASIAASRCCRFSSLPVACSSSSPGRRIVSLAAVGKSSSRSPRTLLGMIRSKLSVASAVVANAPSSTTSTLSFLEASALKHSKDDDLELPSFDPSSGLVDLVIAGGGPSGLPVAERVSRAGERMI